MHSAALLAVGAATLAAALPTTPSPSNFKRQYPGTPTCTSSVSYTMDSQTPQLGAWTAVSGDTCTSSTVDSCSVGASNSISIGVSINVGAGLDIEEIFHVGTDITWTYTTTKTNTITQTCPQGGYVCGLIYQASLMDVKGSKVTTQQGSCLQSGQSSSEPYEFTAPVLISDKPEVRYAACISNQSPNTDAASVGIDMCPEGL
ncbi:MAG: hypothetical protein MMC23_003551 [Stictis urceolatum]|nr:hypothetical protein [Stictis urceolata]